VAQPLSLIRRPDALKLGEISGLNVARCPVMLPSGHKRKRGGLSNLPSGRNRRMIRAVRPTGVKGRPGLDRRHGAKTGEWPKRFITRNAFAAMPTRISMHKPGKFESWLPMNRFSL
jgi:hypothetical protein